MTFFIDASGLMQVALGNKKYEKYLEQDVVTTKGQFLIFYSMLLKQYNEKVANYFFRNVKGIVEDIELDIIPKALTFQEKNKKLSKIDSMSYTFALSKKRLYLTSKKEFKGMNQVVHL